jgi:hypothetical protein
MQDIFPATAERLKEWVAEPAVMGVILVGSKSHGHGDALSDDDLEVFLTSDAFVRLAPVECGELKIEGEGEKRKIIYDVEYTDLNALEHKLSSPHDLDHWPYERARILFDRTGHLSILVRKLAQMDADFRHKRLLHATIDTGGAVYRAQKTLKRGAIGAGHLLVARGAKALARLLFGLEWRWVPLDHWLEAELRTLQDPTQAGPLLVEALCNGDPAPLQRAFDGLEDRLYDAGVPRPDGRHALFFELIHPLRIQERSMHGLS